MKTLAQLFAERKCEVCGEQATVLVRDMIRRFKDLTDHFGELECDGPEHMFCKLHERSSTCREVIDSDPIARRFLNSLT